MGRKAKLTPDQVDVIRRSAPTSTYAKLAEMYDTSIITIFKVVNRKPPYQNEVFVHTEVANETTT